MLSNSAAAAVGVPEFIGFLLVWVVLFMKIEFQTASGNWTEFPAYG